MAVANSRGPASARPGASRRSSPAFGPAARPTGRRLVTPSQGVIHAFGTPWQAAPPTGGTFLAPLHCSGPLLGGVMSHGRPSSMASSHHGGFLACVTVSLQVGMLIPPRWACCLTTVGIPLSGTQPPAGPYGPIAAGSGGPRFAKSEGAPRGLSAVPRRKGDEKR